MTSDIQNEPTYDVEPYITDKRDMGTVLEAEDKEEMIALFSIASRDFKNLIMLKKVLDQLSKGRTQKMRTNSVKEQH
jgi:hypothetical protein